MDKRVIGLVLFIVLLCVGGCLFRASLGLGPFDKVTTIVVRDPTLVIPALLLFIGGIAFLLLLRRVIRSMEKEIQDESSKGKKRCRGTENS